MNESTLRLVSETDVPDSFKFERRLAPRHSVQTRVTAVAHNDGDQTHCTGSIGSLELFDQSATGFGGWSDHPIPMGAKVSLYFPAHGTDSGYDAYGTVVRSLKEADRWSIGINLQVGRAAA